MPRRRMLPQGRQARNAFVKNALATAAAGLAAYGSNKIQRYFQGDVNQPVTAKTVQQVKQMQPVGLARRARRGRPTRGNASHLEKGSLKLADVKTDGTAAHSDSGKALLSFPLQVEVIGGRLFAMSKLYSRWRFMSAVLRFVPSVSSATDGGLVVYYTQEPDDVYTVGEAVGAGVASSAIDNMEFSVREKASMPLHLNPQLLFTTPGSAEPAWHSAGVINVISNGALTVGKTYGSLYLDFVVQFSQPCSPFDVYSPVYCQGTPTGTGASGTNGGPIYNWVNEKASGVVTAESGPQWFIDPSTGKTDVNGKIWLPPLSSACFTLYLSESGLVNNTILLGLDTGVIQLLNSWATSNDHSVHITSAIVTNTSNVVAGFKLFANAAGFSANQITSMTLATYPYRSS